MPKFATYRPLVKFAGDKAPEFKEIDHPRKKDGKFGSGGGGSAAKTSVDPKAGGAAPKPASSSGAAAKGGGAGGQASSPAAPEAAASASKRQLVVAGSKQEKNAKGEMVSVRTAPDGGPLPAHIAALKLPPAWSDVKYSDDPKASLQAQGKDAKGRLQSVYSPEFTKTQAALKFSRVEALAKQFKSIQAQNDANRKSKDARTKDSADCLALVMAMGVRPGSDDDTGADKKAFGATNMLGSHVVETKEGVRLQFTGKKGVALDLQVTDPGIAKMLKERSKAAGPDGALFPNTNDKHLLDYTHTMGDGSFKTKDFRTHLGTKTAADLVNSIEPPKDEKSFKAAVKKVATEVSAKLGNTPIIALQSYINPNVFSAWGNAHAA